MTDDLPTVVCLGTDIGRGHPNYLDSIYSVLKKDYGDRLRIEYWTVFQKSRGFSLLAWRLVRFLYALGGKGGLATNAYNLLRSRHSDIQNETIAMRILGRDLKKIFKESKSICLVAHPFVARMLARVCRVFYVHGEIAGPGECAVSGVEKIYVPLAETRNRLITAGVDGSSIIVTGLIIEPDFVEDAEETYQSRIKRLQSDIPLTVGFFTSGAYPRAHMEKVVAGVNSVIEHNMKAVVFCGISQKMYRWLRTRIKGSSVVDDREGECIPEDWDVRLVTRRNRQTETRRTADFLPEMDALVAASHERTNWAVGLGIPFFVVFPLIGTFAPLNFEFADTQGVAYPLKSRHEASLLGALIKRLRGNGRLLRMAQHGFGTHNIDGARVTAAHIFQSIL